MSARLSVCIDARIALESRRGWGRYATEIIRALSQRDDIALHLFLPPTEPARELAEELHHLGRAVAWSNEAPLVGDTNTDSIPATFLPEHHFDRLDVVHSLTRFVMPTRVRPLVATVHDVAPLSPVGASRPELRESTIQALATLRRPQHHVIAVSQFTRSELALVAGFGEGDIVVVHHGVGESFVHASSPAVAPLERHATPYVLYVGGAGPNKNLATLLNAMPLLADTCRLVLAGDPTWGYAELPVRSQTPWLSFENFVSDRDLAILYRGAAALVLPSIHEGFGLPIIEAMSCGTPIVCSDIPVFHEIAETAAEFFDPRSSADLARAIRNVFVPLRRAELSRAGIEHAVRYRWARAADETIAAYRKWSATPIVQSERR